MKKEETPHRKFVLRGATEIGCHSWAPIRRSGNGLPPGNLATGTDLATTPDAVANPGFTETTGSAAER